MIIKLAALLGATAALALQPALAGTTVETPVRYSREAGGNVWQAGPWQGRFSASGTTYRILEVSSFDRARTEFTVNGPGFEGGLTARCGGRQARTTFVWVTWEHEGVTYSCDYDAAGAVTGNTLDVAIQRRGAMMGLGRHERAGELHWNDEVYQFETRRLSGPRLPTGRVTGYVIRHEGRDIAGMDYRMFQPMLWLPAEGDPHREAALVAAMSLALFMDPANTED